MGLFLKRGKAPTLGTRIAIVGEPTSDYAYVTIDGVVYTTATELLLVPGTNVSIVVGSRATKGDTIQITLDGKIVAGGKSDTTSATYTYTATEPAALFFVNRGFGALYVAYACHISTL